MGADIDEVRFTREDRQRYREKVKLDLEVLRRMLAEGVFEVERKLIGIEVEFHIVGRDGEPAMINEALLQRIENPDFQTELAQFNIEFNVAPHKLVGTVFREIEEELETSHRYAHRQAQELDAHVVTIGILPTLSDLHVTIQNLSANPRYHLLNAQILEARGEDLVVEIEGTERLELTTSTIAMEAAATSVQLHLQVSPAGFPRAWNAAQAISAAQVAVGANSPFLLGKELWRETRIALFQQTIDTRTEELAAQGVRPRVWFGERWIDDVTELFDENVRYFNALLPLLDAEDPEVVLAAGGVPHLPELTLHNGTVWRWNRPIYDVARGKPHLRIENRVLPAGPTVVDTVANAAFYFGLVRGLCGEDDEPIEQRLSFSAAQENFFTAARDGIEAELYWPSAGTVPASELVLRTLLPVAHRGLDAWGVDRRDRDHYLGIIEQRCLKRTTGAGWQVRTFRGLRDEGLERRAALLEMTRRYLDHMQTNEPVHTWPLPR